MKKTQFIELLCTIKKTMVSFISIAFFVALGAAIFLGIGWSVTGFKNTVNNTLEEWNMHDVSITFPYGFDQEEIDKTEQLDYIDKVEGQNSFEANFIINNNRYQTKVILLTDDIDDAHKIIGEIPTKKGEIGFERFWAEKNGIKVGDTICFEHDDDGTAYSIYYLINEDLDALQENKVTEDGMLYLTTDTFIVTGLFENATYVNEYKVTYGVSATTSIPNDCITYVAEDSIDLKAFNGYRTLLLTSPELRNHNTFDNDYKQANTDFIDKLEIDIKDYIDSKNNIIIKAINNIRNDINKKMKDAQEQIAKAEKEIAEGEKKIKDGEIQIANGKDELAKTKIQLEEARKKLDDSWNEYHAGLNTYNDEKSRFDEIEKLYNRLVDVFQFYNYIKNIPDYIKSFFDNYDIAYIEVKEILDSYSTTVTDLIDTFIQEYRSGIFDDNVESLVVAIKQIINDPGYNDLKQKINNLNPAEDSTKYLISIISFIDEINDGIDETLEIYELCKSPFISEIINKTLNDFNDESIKIIKEVLEQINSQITEGKAEIEKFVIIYNKIISMIDPSISLNKAKAQLATAKAQLDAGYAELINGEKQYEYNLNLYKEGKKEIEKNEALIAKYKQDLLEGKKKLAEGKVELEKAKEKVKTFEEKVSEVKYYNASLLGRNMNGGVGSTVVPIDVMDSIKYTMALLFVVVGAFVCYSALSRSVYDQTIQIGTKKALGLSKKEITISFLLYGTLATIIGCFVGVLLARFVIEPIILTVLAKNYIVAENQYYFSIKTSLLFLLFELVVTNLTSYLACNKALKKKAVKLLQGPEDLIGKTHFYEKFPVWNSLSLLTKTIINNCVNDRRRVLATLVGVAGCCSLMVCAICIITNMNDSIDYQVSDVAKFDSVVYFDKNVENSLEKINSVLDEKGIDHYTIAYSSCAIENSRGDYVTGALFVYDDDTFFDFFDVAIDGKRQEVNDGICVTKAFAQYNNVNVGDYVTIVDSIGENHSIKVTAIFDYYLLRAQTVINKETYIKEFGKNPVYNSVLVKRDDYSNSDINDMLYSIDGYISSFDYLDESLVIYSSLTSPMMIVIVTFFMQAVILAFLVLLNLLVMFVDEKKKELIVMMINGYSRKKVKAYIYGDTIFLTIIGIVIGIVMGVIAGFATIRTFNSDCIVIMTNINIPSYLLCAGLTALLSAISCLIALRKVDKFKLTDINSK